MPLGEGDRDELTGGRGGGRGNGRAGVVEDECEGLEIVEDGEEEGEDDGIA